MYRRTIEVKLNVLMKEVVIYQEAITDWYNFFEIFVASTVVHPIQFSGSREDVGIDESFLDASGIVDNSVLNTGF